MKHPNRMQYVLDAACLIVLAVNVPFAVYGYLLFGSVTAGRAWGEGGGDLLISDSFPSPPPPPPPPPCCRLCV